jgi:hypothetical protein
MVFGADAVLRQKLPRFAVGTNLLLLGAALVAGIPQTAENRDRMVTCNRGASWTDSHCYDPDQRSFFAAVTFARDSLPAEARFLVEREAAFAYHSHRIVQHEQIAVGMPDSVFRAYLRDEQIGYVVLTRLTQVEVHELATKLLANCAYFSLVRQFPPYGRLYQFHYSGSSLEPDACGDLTYYVQTTPRREQIR